MIRRIFARLTRKPPATDNPQERRLFHEFDVLIAKRALRLHNRSADGAAKYARIQTILARGRDAEIRR